MAHALIALTVVLLAAGLRSSLAYGDSQPGGGVDGTAGKGEPAPGRDTAAEGVSEPTPLQPGEGATPCAPNPTALPVPPRGEPVLHSTFTVNVPAPAWLDDPPSPDAVSPLGVLRGWQALPAYKPRVSWRRAPVAPPDLEQVSAGWTDPPAWLAYMPTGARGAA